MVPDSQPPQPGMANSSRPAYLMSSNEQINVGSDILDACPPKSSLLGLPKELRLEIYRYLLSTKYIRCKTPYQVSVSRVLFRPFPSIIYGSLLMLIVQKERQVRNQLLHLPLPQANPAHMPSGIP